MARYTVMVEIEVDEADSKVAASELVSERMIEMWTLCADRWPHHIEGLGGYYVTENIRETSFSIHRKAQQKIRRKE